MSEPVLRGVSPRDLKAMLADAGELALFDVREELIFSRGHLLHARSLPLSRLELRIRALVPRRATPVVLVDDGDGLAQRAAGTLARLGYTNLAALDGGIAGWTAAGFELFSGINVPSKAFGEFVEHADATPNIGAEELEKLLRERADVVVLDSRPFDEYSRMSIPTGIDVPGAELVLRVRDLAPSPETTVVVNCAGRTRSIIGAQSLINAGVPNKVAALRNGTMGWNLAGFDCDSGQTRRAPNPSADALAWARSAAAGVAERFGVRRIENADLDRLRNDAERTLYVFDVRDPEEYAAGHVAGSVSAPGGQLVQATDQYVGTLGARIVVIDEKEVRALMTGSWLRQMGFRDVFVLAQTGAERRPPADDVPGLDQRPEFAIDPAALAGLIARGAATVIDLSLSRTYRRGHIPGAWFAIRARLKQALGAVPAREYFVLTSEDGRLADLAAPEVAALSQRPVRYLKGGNAAWQAAGHPLTADDPNLADEPIDVWLRPYERAGGVREGMVEYLTWETDLPERIARDGTADFAQFRA
jgi:rhodanese-related sulfurtransferase